MFYRIFKQSNSYVSCLYSFHDWHTFTYGFEECRQIYLMRICDSESESSALVYELNIWLILLLFGKSFTYQHGACKAHLHQVCVCVWFYLIADEKIGSSYSEIRQSIEWHLSKRKENGTLESFDLRYPM